MSEQEISSAAAENSEQNTDTGYLRTLLQLGATLNVTLELSQVLNIAIEQVVQP